MFHQITQTRAILATALAGVAATTGCDRSEAKQACDHGFEIQAMLEHVGTTIESETASTICRKSGQNPYLKLVDETEDLANRTAKNIKSTAAVYMPKKDRAHRYAKELITELRFLKNELTMACYRQNQGDLLTARERLHAAHDILSKKVLPKITQVLEITGCINTNPEMIDFIHTTGR